VQDTGGLPCLHEKAVWIFSYYLQLNRRQAPEKMNTQPVFFTKEIPAIFALALLT